MALIMVAEDTPEIAQLVKLILQARGHQVVTVPDGLQMVEKAKDWKPHLIIADIMMPGTYGTAAYKALQEDPTTAAIPVAFLTAVPLEQARKLVPEGPKVRLLKKPVEIPVLMKAVEELLPPKS
ncbi:MAG: response regulator [Elusimicrobiota bacterium]